VRNALLYFSHWSSVRSTVCQNKFSCVHRDSALPSTTALALTLHPRSSARPSRARPTFFTSLKEAGAVPTNVYRYVLLLRSTCRDFHALRKRCYSSLLEVLTRFLVFHRGFELEIASLKCRVGQRSLLRLRFVCLCSSLSDFLLFERRKIGPGPLAVDRTAFVPSPLSLRRNGSGLSRSWSPASHFFPR